MDYTNLFNLLIKVGIMVSVGYFLRRRSFIDDILKQKLSSLLLRVALPLSVVATGNNAFSQDVVFGLLWSAVFTLGYYVCALLAMFFISRPLPLSQQDKSLMCALGVFANVSFLGYPISYAMFSDVGVLYAVVYNLGWQIFVSFFAPRLFSKNVKISFSATLKDPLLWASVVAIVIFVSPFRLPAAIVGAFADIGSMSIPLSMFIVGCSVADTKLSQIFTMPQAYLVSALRLLIFPLIMLFVLRSLGFSGALLGTSVLLTAMPCGSTNVLFAQQYGANVKFATAAVVQGMLLMVFTLPLLVYIMDMLLHS